MSLTSNNSHLTRELTLSSRCVFNTRFIDSNTKEVLYSTRTPKAWFTRQSVTTLARHAPSTNQPSGSKPNSPVIPQPASPNLVEKLPVLDDVSSESPKIAPSLHYAPGDEKEMKEEGGNEVEVTKIQWKFFRDTLFEHDFQTKDVNEIMEKSGLRPLRLYVSSVVVSSRLPKLTPRINSDRTFKVNGISYKWDLGLIGFDSPTVSTLSSRYPP